MSIIIRHPNIEILTEQGIPKDFAEIRDYFNSALKRNKLYWIPRKNPITDEEIKNLWIPSLEKNISLVAESNRRVIGSLTVFYDPDSTAYEYRKQRKCGNIGFSADLDCNYELTATEMIKVLIEKLKSEKKKAVWTMAKESPGNKILADLNYKGRLLKSQERYLEAGLSGEVFEYFLP